MPGDRSDMLPGLLLAHASGSFPQLAGIILLGGYEIPDTIARLINGIHNELPDRDDPAGHVHGSGQDVPPRGRDDVQPPQGRGRAPPVLRARRRACAARRAAGAPLRGDDAADVRAPAASTSPATTGRTSCCPRATRTASSSRRPVLLRRGVADLTLLGDAQAIKPRAAQLGLDMLGGQVVDPDDPELREKFAAEYARAAGAQGRHHRAGAGEARRPVLLRHDDGARRPRRRHGLRRDQHHGAHHPARRSSSSRRQPGVHVVSERLPHVPAPTACSSTATAPSTPTRPPSSSPTSRSRSAADGGRRSASSRGSRCCPTRPGTSGTGADVDKVRAATALVRERAPDLLVEGPIQYDAAVDAAVAATKLPDCRSPGRATVFIFPDLNTGNNTYKAVQRSAGAVAIGPVLQGLQQAGQRPLPRRARRRTSSTPWPSPPSRHRPNQEERTREHPDPAAELRLEFDQVPGDRRRLRGSGCQRHHPADRG